MTISFEMRLSVPEDVLMRELGGESVLLNLNRECYFGLDEVGTRMWTALTASESIQAAYERLLDEYEVDGERLRQDLSALIEKLMEQGLVEVHGE